eukprot:scaffold273767_cov48-Prasinocladus_malaysianus.AAC.1
MQPVALLTETLLSGWEIERQGALMYVAQPVALVELSLFVKLGRTAWDLAGQLVHPLGLYTRKSEQHKD